MSRLIVVVLAALATASPQAVIEARQSGFKKMGAAMKAIAEQLKSDAPDVTKMAAAAQAIAAGAQEQPTWFPAGSGPEAGVDTDALPHIWQDTGKFAALSTQLQAESGKLTSTLAGKDLGAIRTQFKTLADVCSTCHRSFRAD